MKKILLFVLLFCMILTISACKSDNDPNTTQGNADHASEAGNQPETKNVDTNTDESLPGTVSVSLPNVQFCVSAPDKNIRRAGSGDLVIGDSYFVIYDCYVDPSSELIYNVDLAKIQNPEDVIEQMKEQIIGTCSTRLLSAKEYSLVIEKSENVKVNEWDMNRAEGKIILTEDYQLDYNEVRFVAYGIIKQNQPIYIIVVDVPSDNVEHIDIGEMADRIAKTFRENPDN